MNTFLEYIKRGTKQVEKGIKKYGKTLDYSELSIIELAENSLEEKIDDVFYTIKLLEKIKEQERELLSLREKLDNRSVSNEVKEQYSRSCHSCKHLDMSAYKEPCKTCCNKHNWQPRNEGSE